jgi:hypothetical protein
MRLMTRVSMREQRSEGERSAELGAKAGERGARREEAEGDEHEEDVVHATSIRDPRRAA